ncbi:MAG: hypothetical protein V4603_03070 [Pseudomonadota bacterium]
MIEPAKNSSIPFRFQRQDLLAIAGLVALPLLFFYRVLWTETHTLLGNWDASAQSFAWYAKIARALQEGSFPFWDFQTDSGNYFPGELQTAAFYPFSWLFALVYVPGDAHGLQFWAELYSVLHFSLCAVLSYLFLRELKLTTVPAVLGAIIASLFGAMAERVTGQPNIHAGMVWVPGVLFMVQRAWNQQDPHRSLFSASLAGIMLGCCILSGHMYSYIHGAFFAFMLLLFTCGLQKQLWPRALKILTVVALCSLLLTAVQLGPTLEYLRRALKWYGAGSTEYPHVVPFEEFARWQFSSWHTLLTWECSTSACGENRTLYVGWTALPLALLALIVNRYARRVVLPIIGVILIVAMAGDNMIGRILYNVPVLDNVRIPTRILFGFPVFVGVLAALGLQYLLGRLQGKRLLQGALIVVATLGIAVDLHEAHKNWTLTGLPRDLASIKNPETFYSQPVTDWLEAKLQGSLYRWVAEPSELLPPNYGHYAGINSVRGHRSSMLQNYSLMFSAYEDPTGWMPRLGLKYLVKDVADPNLNQVFASEGKYVYELPSALPLVHGIVQGVHQALPIKSVVWETNSLHVQLDPAYVPQAGDRLFFGVTYYPGFQLQVNGEERLLLHREEDGAFQSAELLPGDSQVELQFVPRKMYRAYFCLLLLAGWLVYLRRNIRAANVANNPSR